MKILNSVHFYDQTSRGLPWSFLPHFFEVPRWTFFCNRCNGYPLSFFNVARKCKKENHKNCWLGGLDHFLFFHIFGNFIIPIDFLIFQRGRRVQPPAISIDYPYIIHILTIYWNHQPSFFNGKTTNQIVILKYRTNRQIIQPSEPSGPVSSQQPLKCH